MASQTTITVLCPNARRQTVKISPNTSILEILEEACRKQSLKPDDYDIKHYGKLLDLSLSVRFANLPNNALLELSKTERIRHESSVTIALQLESGERLTGNFPPSSSLLDIIENCMDSRNNAASVESLPDTEPVCIYMRQKFTGDQIKTTTLRNLGLTSGKAIIRLLYRPIDSFEEQAHITRPLSKPLQVESNQVSQKKPASSELNDDHIIKKQPKLESEATCSTSNENSVGETVPMELAPKDVDAKNVESPICNRPSPLFEIGVNGNSSELVLDNSSSLAMEEDDNNVKQAKEIGQIIYIGARNAVLFNLEDILECKKEDIPDEFFELTVDDVRYLFEEYKRTRSELENQPLLLRQQREVGYLKKLTCYKQTVIRIYFPNHLVLQGTFIVNETVQAVVDFVKTFLENPDLDFYLYITPPKTRLKENNTLLEAKLVPAAVVYFGCDTPCENYLLDNIRSQISDPRAASQAAIECREKGVSSEALTQLTSAMVLNEESSGSSLSLDYVPTLHLTTPSGSVNHRTSPAGEAQSKVPAWFKLGNK